MHVNRREDRDKEHESASRGRRKGINEEVTQASLRRYSADISEKETIWRGSAYTCLDFLSGLAQGELHADRGGDRRRQLQVKQAAAASRPPQA